MMIMIWRGDPQNAGQALLREGASVVSYRLTTDARRSIEKGGLAALLDLEARGFVEARPQRASWEDAVAHATAFHGRVADATLRR